MTVYKYMLIRSDNPKRKKKNNNIDHIIHIADSELIQFDSTYTLTVFNHKKYL